MKTDEEIAKAEEDKAVGMSRDLPNVTKVATGRLYVLRTLRARFEEPTP